MLLQALKGAALSCLHALRIAPRPASPAWLCTVTGYSDKTVTRALQKLQELKIACYSTLELENAGLQEAAAVEIDLETLLEAIHELFGEPLLLPRKQAPDERLLLSLAADAQHKRVRLRYPARAICGSLKRRRIPDLKYRQHPEEYLPVWFMERIGLSEAVAAACEESLEPAPEPGDSEKWAFAID